MKSHEIEILVNVFPLLVYGEQLILFGTRTLQRDDPSWTLMGKPDKEPTVERWSRGRRRIICLFL